MTPSSVDLSVASFNIRYGRADDGPDSWPLRKESTAAELAEVVTWDVAGLQEALQEQVDYLSEHVPHNAVVSVGRDDGISAGEHCTVLVDNSDLEVVSAQSRWLSEDPDVPGSVSWDSSLTRMVTMVRLRHVPSGVRFGFANAHFDHVGETARIESARLIDGWLREDEHPWIFVGDLNDLPGSPCLQVFADAGWTSALGADAGSTCHSFGGTDHGQIDHILCTPGITVTGAGIDTSRPGGRFPSDHYAIWANVTVC